MAYNVSFNPAEFSRPRIHDIIVGAMGELKNTRDTLGGTNVKARNLSKEKRQEVEGQVAKLNTLGKDLEDKSKRLEAYSKTARKGGFTPQEAKALYCKSRIMYKLGEAAKEMNPDKTLDNALGSAAKEVVQQTIEISRCGKDEVPVADENIKALDEIGGDSVKRAKGTYGPQIKRIVKIRNSPIFETHFDKAPSKVIPDKNVSKKEEPK